MANENRDFIHKLLAKFSNIGITTILSDHTISIDSYILAPYIGATLEEVLLKTGEEINNRKLSTREKYRIGLSISFVIDNSLNKLKNGLAIRNDNFFENFSEDRTSAEELLEGLLISMQSEYEEKKIKHVSKMFSNFLFDNTWDKQFCNYYLRIANQLTYRQFCYIYLLSNKAKYGLDRKIDILKDPYISLRGDQILELLELRNRGIIYIPEIFLHFHPEHGAQTFPLENVIIIHLGKYLYELLELSTIDLKDIESLCGFKLLS